MTSDLEKPQDVFSDEEHGRETTPWEALMAGANPMATNSALTLKHLEEAENQLFCTPEKMKFDILDILSKNACVFEGKPRAYCILFQMIKTLKPTPFETAKIRSTN